MFVVRAPLRFAVQGVVFSCSVDMTVNGGVDHALINSPDTLHYWIDQAPRQNAQRSRMVCCVTSGGILQRCVASLKLLLTM